MKALILLGAVFGAHSAYYLLPDGSRDRAWTAYVGTHALVVCALAMLLRNAGAWRQPWMASVWVFACAWGMLESGQAVGCALLKWGTLSGADLCEQAFGREIYAAAAALGVAWALSLVWQRRKPRGGGRG